MLYNRPVTVTGKGVVLLLPRRESLGDEDGVAIGGGMFKKV